MCLYSLINCPIMTTVHTKHEKANINVMLSTSNSMNLQYFLRQNFPTDIVSILFSIPQPNSVQIFLHLVVVVKLAITTPTPLNDSTSSTPLCGITE